MKYAKNDISFILVSIIYTALVRRNRYSRYFVHDIEALSPGLPKSSRICQEKQYGIYKNYRVSRDFRYLGARI